MEWLKRAIRIVYRLLWSPVVVPFWAFGAICAPFVMAVVWATEDRPEFDADGIAYFYLRLPVQWITGERFSNG